MSENVVVLIATANRPESLNHTLQELTFQDTREFSLTIVIVDNGLEYRVRDVVDLHRDRLSLVYEASEISGRSESVNRVLEGLSCDILIFTDDDITPSANWSRNLVRAFREGSDRIACCGPIRPVYPSSVPKWLEDSPLEQIAYAQFMPQQEAGLLPMSVLPFGPNFAVRREAVKGLFFREDLGPSLLNGPLSCDDIQFAGDVRNRYMPLVANGGFFYVPDAVVEHRVRSEQMSDDWIFDRFLSYGRSLVQMRGVPAYLYSPSLLRLRNDDRPEVLIKRQSAEYSFYLGVIQQLEKLNKQDSVEFYLNWLSLHEEYLETLRLGPSGERSKRLLGL